MLAVEVVSQGAVLGSGVGWLQRPEAVPGLGSETRGGRKLYLGSASKWGGGWGCSHNCYGSPSVDTIDHLIYFLLFYDKHSPCIYRRKFVFVSYVQKNLFEFAW